MKRRRTITVAIAVALLLLVAGASTQLSKAGAGGLLHPFRRAVTAPVPPGCEVVTLRGAGVTLHGWRCRASAPRRGTLIYLHGVADNRGSASGVIARFTQRGFDVVAYDSRAHGESEGDACTYGFYEKEDLRCVIDSVDTGPVVLLGTSLGAAVALQHAGRDARVAAVVAAETFSDLRTIATERAPFFFTSALIAKSFALAEEQGHFRVDAVTPVAAAATITAPVLLIHGALDVDTPPAHARRVFAALTGPKRLILVPGARHNESLRGDIWNEIDQWLDSVLPPRVAGKVSGAPWHPVSPPRIELGSGV